MKHTNCFLAQLLLILTLAAAATPVLCDEATVDYVASTLWTGIEDIAVQGDYAYLALPYGLLVVDISDPADPVEVGRLVLEGATVGLDIAGDLVCAASSGHGMQLVDVADPSAPVLVGTWGMGNSFHDVFIYGNYAYPMVWGIGAFIVDISDPTNPIQTSSSNIYGYHDMCVEGDYAYVSYGYSQIRGSLKILDMSTPETEVVLSSYEGDVNTSLYGVAVAGGYAFVAGGGRGLYVFDISDPNALTLVDWFDTPGSAADVQVAGDYAFVADFGSGITVMDISNPEAPVVVDSYKPDDRFVPNIVELVGDVLVTNGDDTRLNLLGISNPVAPSTLGQLSLPGRSSALALSGDKLWAGDGSGVVNSVDVTNPVDPTPIPDENLTSIGNINEVVIQGDFLYAATWEGVAVHDLNDPMATPWEGLSGQYVHSIAVQGNLMVAYTGYFNSSDGRLYFYDITDPMAPVYLNESGFLYGYAGVDIAGDYAYAGGFFHGTVGDQGILTIFDISDPSNPTVAATFQTPGPPRDVEVVGDLAFVADHFYGLSVLDVSDPTAPSLVGQTGCCNWANTITVAGSVAYLCSDWGPLSLVDISIPEAPVAIAEYETPGEANHVVVDGDLVYVADTCGVLILEVTLPAGACCLPDGSCIVADLTECEGSLGGTYLGIEAECRGDLDENGVDDACQPVGACCLPGGGCVTTHQPQCEITLGGSYFGDGTACLGDSDYNGYDDACEPTGACCLTDNTCAIATETDCETTLDGEYLGDMTLCQGDSNEDGFDDVCVPVTCCVGRVGDANNSGSDMPTIGDISIMTDAKFISLNCNVPIVCFAEADINRSGGVNPTCDDITIGDISMLIDYLFIAGPTNMTLPDCF